MAINQLSITQILIRGGGHFLKHLRYFKKLFGHTTISHGLFVHDAEGS